MKKNGFTLVELLVSAGIFSIIVITTVGIFVSAIKLQSTILSSKKIMGEINYALELMSRNLRMALKDKTGECITAGNNYDYHPTLNNKGIRFRNVFQSGECQEFYLEGGQIKFKRYASGPAPEIMELTSGGIEIKKLIFFLSGQSQADNLQPLVTIYLEAKSGIAPTLKIQTSVSQRNIDASY